MSGRRQVEHGAGAAGAATAAALGAARASFQQQQGGSSKVAPHLTGGFSTLAAPLGWRASSAARNLETQKHAVRPA